MFILYLLLTVSFSFAQYDLTDCSPKDLLCIVVNEQASIIGGLDSLYSKIIYPEEAKLNRIEGKVYVYAIVDTNGILLCCKVTKGLGLGYGCDEEAIRLVNSSRFTPAYNPRGPITTQVFIPILFKLPK